MTDIKENTSWQGESREIKFRAFDGTWTHKMMYSDDTNLSAFFSQASQTEYNKNIMQYTWLKDKNWVEIYEWDIVSSNLWLLKWDVYYRQEWLYEIRWAWWLFEYDMWRFEVIWNIYSNPELLSEK